MRPAPSVQAHPADQYKQVHDITFTEDGIILEWAMYPGVLLAPSIWSEADMNENNEIDVTEAFTWAAPRIPYMVGTLDEETRVEWEVEDVTFPPSLREFQLRNEAIHIRLRAEYPPFFSGEHQLEIQNYYEEAQSTSWYYVYTEGDTGFRKPEQQNTYLKIDFVLSPEEDNDFLTAWDSGVPDIGVSSSETSSSNAADLLTDSENSTPLGISLNELMERTNYLAILGIALVLGSFHALTPGHGKALVGAYLVGARGTYRHAIVLGLIVTLTHTGSVMIVGALTLLASQFFVPTTIFPILEIASGLLVVGLGLFLFRQRLQGMNTVIRQRRATEEAEKARQALEAESTAIPAKEPEKTPAVVPAEGKKRVMINEPIKVNIYDDVLPDENRGMDTVRWRSLIGLGFSGGLVPCPEAIVTLLIAVAVNRILMGLSLILTFSAGMAFVLVAIGLMIVKSSSIFGKDDWFNRMAPGISMFSSIIVIALGIGLTYNAVAGNDLMADAEKEADSAIHEDDTAEKAFSVNDAKIIIVSQDDGGFQQLYAVSPRDNTAEQLTFEKNGIWNYAISPDNRTIIYAVRQPYEGSGLWVIDASGSNRRVALSCGTADCGNPLWAPDGRSVLYERINLGEADQADYGLISLWNLNAATGETAPIFDDSTFQGLTARWSPDGQWLGYVSPQNVGIQVYNLSDGRSITIETRVSSHIVWAPDSQSFLFFDMELLEATDEQAVYIKRLKHYDIATDTITPLTEDRSLEDRWAAWSPDGETVVVVRGVLEENGALRGDEIWRMNPDGSDAAVLNDSPGFVYGTPDWAPDNRHLTFTRYAIDLQGSASEVVILDSETGHINAIYAPAYAPAWLP